VRLVIAQSGTFGHGVSQSCLACAQLARKRLHHFLVGERFPRRPVEDDLATVDGVEPVAVRSPPPRFDSAMRMETPIALIS